MSVADPKPGTAEAAARGCTCPSAMNPRQADFNDKLTWDADGTWWVHMDCPVHRATPASTPGGES